MNVKKMLKDGAKQILPDDKLKEQIKYRMGIDGEEEVSLGAVKAKRRNRVIIAVSCGLAAVIAVCAFIPLMLRRDDGHTPATPSDPGNIFGELSTADEIYGFSAASALAMLGGMQPEGAAAMSAVSGRAADDGDAENIEKINGYMQVVESLTSGKGYTVTGGENGGAYPEYGYVMKISYTDALGESRDGGTIYYNKTFEEGEFEDGESEVTYSLEGVMVEDGNEYAVAGTHSTESEEDESESEYTLRIDLGGGMFIVVEQQHENEEGESETEYCYTLYSGGNTAYASQRDRDDDDDDDNGRYAIISQTTIEYETEDSETELVITETRSGERQVFAFEAEDGRILVRLGGAFTDVVYTVTIENGQYVYTRGGAEVGREERRGRHDD